MKLDVCIAGATGWVGRHLVVDDEGGPRDIASVQAWSKLAIDQGCRASFKHKGISPFNAYSPGWFDTPPPAGDSKPREALQALKDARYTSTSPCADE